MGTRNQKDFKYPFQRPWMREYGAAAAASGTGVKGIIAGWSLKG